MSYADLPTWYKNFLNSIIIKDDVEISDRDFFIVNRIPGVIKTALKFSRDGEELMDRIQDGVVGLLRAYEKYDPELNGFYDYSKMWVSAAILDGFRVSRNIVTSPRNTFVRGKAIKKMLSEGKTTKEIVSFYENSKGPRYKKVCKESIEHYKNTYVDNLPDNCVDLLSGSFEDKSDLYIHAKIILMLENLSDIKLESILCRISGRSSQELANKRKCSRTNINNHIRDVQNRFSETFKGVDY